MSKAKLKKTLAQMPAEQLVELVLELYDARKEAKEYLEFWLEPDTPKALEKAKKKVERVFYSGEDSPRKRPSLTELNRITRDFTSQVFDTESIADLLIYVAEKECEWLEGRWRRLSYRSSIKKNVDTAALYIEQAYGTEPDPVADGLRERMERVRTRAAGLYHYPPW